MGTVVALFNNYTDAQRAANTLVDSGFDRSSISFAARESAVTTPAVAGVTDGQRMEYQAQAVPAGVGEHALAGAGEGAMVGGGVGLAAGVAALMIPGLGPLFVTGALASVITSALAGATAGAAIGGLAGALTEHGLPVDTANMYAQSVQSGGVIVSVYTDRVQQARDILQASNATNVQIAAAV